MDLRFVGSFKARGCDVPDAFKALAKMSFEEHARLK
jgi:hypothetical protein